MSGMSYDYELEFKERMKKAIEHLRKNGLKRDSRSLNEKLTERINGLVEGVPEHEES
jgi:hypothetical protein